MKKLPSLIIFAIITVTCLVILVGSDEKSSLSFEPVAKTTEETESEIEEKLWISTVARTNSHSFGYSGDITNWNGWYYDTIRVGDDIMLNYDSISPSVVRLNLITREIDIDLNDIDAPSKIKSFMNPINGFHNFQQNYEEVLDSIVDEEYGIIRCYGYFSFTSDYADSCLNNADKINRFICELTGMSENEAVKVPELSALFAGFKTTKYYRPVYTGNSNNMRSLSDFLAYRTFENWRRGGDTDQHSNGARLEIRAHILNSKFLTLSIYDYDRIGTGHGIYTQTFHTLDLASGKGLSNKDIFKNNSIDKVKKLLFETMIKDSKYAAWHPDVVNTGNEGEAEETDFNFELPEGALTNEGVVFSFQPYEIDCWAAGAYHFIVPYSKLNPYLTPKVKRMLTSDRQGHQANAGIKRRHRS